MTPPCSGPEAADLLALIHAWCREHLPALDLETAEAWAQTVGRQAAALVFELSVGRAGHHGGLQGSRLPCSCGGESRFVGYRGRWVRSFQGEVRVERAYYHCAACGTGRAPWDEAQGLTEASFTPAFKAALARLCARLPYREAAEEMALWTGQTLAESTLEAITGEVGARLRAAEDRRTTAWFDQGKLPPAAPLAAQVRGKRAYLSIDAAKAHVDGSWHDMKVATFSRGERQVFREPDGCLRLGDDTARETQYLAVQEEAEGFGRRLYVWALGHGAERAELVVLADGAEWIWKLADTHFSDARQILDFYHAAEHLSELGRAVFGAESPEGSAWAAASRERLATQGPRGLLASLRELRREHAEKLTAEVRREVVREVQYFRRHRRRMQYPQYRAAGLMIGSGPVEAGCKSLVGQRLKGTGMRWSRAGADAVVGVRAALVSGRTDLITAAARAA